MPGQLIALLRESSSVLSEIETLCCHTKTPGQMVSLQKRLGLNSRVKPAVHPCGKPCGQLVSASGGRRIVLHAFSSSIF